MCPQGNNRQFFILHSFLIILFTQCPVLCHPNNGRQYGSPDADIFSNTDYIPAPPPPPPPPTPHNFDQGQYCLPHEFQCLQLNLNQILSINDWNRRPRECIPQSYRCDGRHDCQDGSDEVECFVQLPRKKEFKCFVGYNYDTVVEDCLKRGVTPKNDLDPRETSRSVSEMKEWVCSKIDRPNGEVIRDCMQLYTGGEAFRVCYTNEEDGSTCLCSSELCNGSRGSQPLLPILLLNVFSFILLCLLADFFS